MTDKNKQFPQYRKLPNGKSLYRIDSERLFVELQKIGSSWWLHNVEAKQYPEILRIMDMLQLNEPFILSTKNEFETLYNLVKKNVEN
jgi:hypothetical protein